MRKVLVPVVPLVFLASLLASTAHAAEHDMRPGLWEVTTTSDLLRLVPLIPPDQMQALTNLARQNGFEIPDIQNGAATSRACITQDMAKQKNLPDFYQLQSGCAVKGPVYRGNKYRWEFACASAAMKGNGSAEGTFTSPESFSGRTDFDGVVQGNPVNEHADIRGRWIGASCTAVKPAQ